MAHHLELDWQKKKVKEKLFYPYLGSQSYTDTITNTDTDKELSITAAAQSKQALI